MDGISLRGARKYFPQNGVEALSDASFDLVPGEIHAIAGENGAGKSTLVGILAGHLELSSGSLLVDGRERSFAAPREALEAGIGLVRQHPRSVPGFALWEDCVLGAEPTRGLALSPKAAREAVAELSCRWGFDLDPDARTETLAVSQLQKAAILALLLRGVRCLILDEPTAVLAPAETDKLFALLRQLKAEGKGVAIISHKLSELTGLADRVTVLRRGRSVGTRAGADLTVEELRSLMFGFSPGTDLGAQKGPKIGIGNRPAPGGTDLEAPALRVRGLEVHEAGRPFLRGLDLELRAGSVLGVAGVRESGLETLERAVSGLSAPSAGSVEVFGKSVGGNARAARDAGMAYVPADRLGVALAPRLSLQDNLTVHGLARGRRLLDGRALRMQAQRLARAAGLEVDTARPAASFSGGTLQKLVLARELERRPALVVLAEPGWGLDAEAKAALDGRLRRLADEGAAVLLLSTDLDELLALSDEIVVLRDGRITGRFKRGQTSEELREAVGAAMVGMEACDDRG